MTSHPDQWRTDWDVDEFWPTGRCEADHKDGGVCLRRLGLDDTCPGEPDHAEAAA